MASFYYAVFVFSLLILAVPTSTTSISKDAARVGKRCTTTISSASDITASNLACTTIDIQSFTMTAGKTMAITGLADGTTVNLLGDITFGVSNWGGPLFQIGTSSSNGTFTFNGNGHTFDGQGASYWDGLGTNGGVTKPRPMLKVTKGGGSFKDVTILNSPAHAFRSENTAPMLISGVTIDDSAGDDGGGHNTDCFDVDASNLVLTGNTCKNQDDCLAINNGSNITFSSNSCSGGHGISIGSIASGKIVNNINISDNEVTNSDNGLRIKTVYGANESSVTNIVYKGNSVSGIRKYGVIIEQDYENGGPSGTPSDGVTLGPVTFSADNVVAAVSGADRAYVLCGASCTGIWDWSGLKTSGGNAGSSNYDDIVGYTF